MHIVTETFSIPELEALGPIDTPRFRVVNGILYCIAHTTALGYVVVYSHDGFVWGVSALPVSEKPPRIVHTGSRYVVVPANKNAGYATADSWLNWQPRTAPGVGGLSYEDAVFDGSEIIAVPQQNATYGVTPDGLSWVERSGIPPSTGSRFSAAVIAGTVVLGGETVTVSNDATTWGIPTNAPPGPVAVSNGMFVTPYATSDTGAVWVDVDASLNAGSAVIEGGDYPVLLNTLAADGKSQWVVRSTETGFWSGVAETGIVFSANGGTWFNGRVYVTTGTGTAGFVRAALVVETWETRKIKPSAFSFGPPVVGNGFVAAAGIFASEGAMLTVTRDGKNWENIRFDANIVATARFNQGVAALLLGGSGSLRAVFTPDGKRWTDFTAGEFAPGGWVAPRACTQHGEYLYALMFDGGLWRTSDLLTWAQVTTLPSANDWAALISNGSALIAIDWNGVVYSTDNIVSWAQVADIGWFQDGIASGGTFYVIGGATGLTKSENGTAWSDIDYSAWGGNITPSALFPSSAGAYVTSVSSGGTGGTALWVYENGEFSVSTHTPSAFPAGFGEVYGAVDYYGRVLVIGAMSTGTYSMLADGAQNGPFWTGFENAVENL